MSSLLEESHPVPLPSTSSSLPNPPPIPSFQLRETICDVPTELLIQTFDDRVLVIITQNGKVGCLTQASLPPHIPLPPPPKPLSPSSSSPNHPSALDILSILPQPSPALSLTPLLGSPPSPSLYDLYISQISTLIFWALETSGQGRRNVVVGLSLRRSPRNQEEGQDEGEDVLDDGERERYAGIMDLVSRWPGPAE